MLYRFLTYCLLLSVVAACTKLKRDYTIDMGAPASAGDLALSSYYERRQAIAVTLPQFTIDDMTANLRAEIDGKTIAATDAEKPKTNTSGGFKITHKLDDVSFKICLKDIKLIGAGRGKIEVVVEIKSCGLSIDIHSGELQIEPPIGREPVIMTVRNVSFKRKDLEDTLRVRVGIAMRQDGHLAILDAHLDDGFRDLTNPDQYDIDVGLSGAEAATGWLGKTVNEAKADLIGDLIDLSRARIVLSMERAVQRAVGRATKRIADKSLIKGYKAKTKSFEINLAARLSGLSGTSESGINLVANTLVAGRVNIDALGSPLLDDTPPARGLKCKITHRTLPDAKPNSLAELNSIPLAPVNIASASPPLADAIGGSATGSSAPPSTDPKQLAHGRFFLPFEFIQNLAWLNTGDLGDCTFSLNAKGDTADTGIELRATWSEPAQLKLSSTTHRGHKAIKMILSFGKLEVTLNAAVRQKLGNAGLLPALLSKPTDIFPLSGLEYPLYIELLPATSSAPAQVFLAVEDQDRYQSLSDLDWDLLTESLRNDIAQANKMQDLAPALSAIGRALIDQIIAPKFADTPFSITEDNDDPIDVESLEFQSTGIAVGFAFDPKAVSKDEKTGLRLADASSAAVPQSAHPRLESLEKLGFPALIGLPADQARILAAKNFGAAPDWNCRDDVAPPIAAPDLSTIAIQYRRCTLQPTGAVELSWIIASLGQDHDAEHHDLVVGTRLSTAGVFRKALLPALDASQLIAAMNEPPKFLITPPSVQLSWIGDDLAVVATGFCRSPDKDQCNAAQIAGGDQLLITELKAYVP